MMPALVAYNHMTLDGYFAGPNGEISWFAPGVRDPEFHRFMIEHIRQAGSLLFGRVTYQLMASYWQTEEATRNDPDVAERMNNLAKVVFSTTLERVDWNGAKLFRDQLATRVRKMKEGPGKPITILGSGTLVSQLAQENLIDQYQIVVNPVAVGQGKTMFEGGKEILRFRLTKTQAFSNGNVLMCYEPAA
jgi:dihydrofolate reductase